MQAGAFTYIHKPFEFDELRLDIEKAMEGKRLREKVADLELRERGKYDFTNIIAVSASMKAVLNLSNHKIAVWYYIILFYIILYLFNLINKFG